ncbi:MAG: hypothetical protein NZ822_01720 [Patescibacteria group bacterium]|nr:hypothetical protein [Patescibacteria group bacterium]
MNDRINEKVENLINKAKISLEKLDLSSEEDLSIALMNLISIEEHFYFSGAKTKNHEYFDLLNEVRKIRKELLGKLVKNKEEGAEIWCLSKHLLAATMRLIEVGTKEMDKNNKETAYELFEKAYYLYSLFWGINLGVLEIGEVKKIEENKLNKNDKGKDNIFDNLGQLVKRIVDCCRE